MPQHPVYGLDLTKLSVAERISLAQDLWDSVYDEANLTPISDKNRRIVEQRLREADDPATVWYDREDLHRHIQAERLRNSRRS